jgi:uncharacterized repeat protein (TIGR03803 family)
MQSKKLSTILRAALAIFAVVLLGTGTRAVAQAEKLLYTFSISNLGRGSDPAAGLIFDAAGNLYGTTEYGGDLNSCPGLGCGTVFELSPRASGGWTETVLHRFDVADGASPLAGVIFDSSGNLYGTTAGGGGRSNNGTVFELSPKAGGGWTETLLHVFNNDGDASNPRAGLIFDSSGNLYGTTYGGGKYGDGTVFELSPNSGGGWTEAILYNFNEKGNSGANPQAGLISDSSGNLYGTTSGGGKYFYGNVFELSPKANSSWTLTILHSFDDEDGLKDGTYPMAGLTLDSSGNLYGTTYSGGKYYSGTVFELSPKAGGGWTETILHSFGIETEGSEDGLYPLAGVTFDAAGNLYGTTQQGGNLNYCTQANGCGTVFELSPTLGGGWTEKVLHSFNISDGNYPSAGLVFGASGNPYGTTFSGGPEDDYGTVFEITP